MMDSETMWMIVLICQIIGVVIFSIFQIVDCWRNGI